MRALKALAPFGERVWVRGEIKILYTSFFLFLNIEYKEKKYCKKTFFSSPHPSLSPLGERA